ncbi:general transcription factor IIH, polypeptide 5, transcript variant X2, partial [Columba livia]
GAVGPVGRESSRPFTTPGRSRDFRCLRVEPKARVVLFTFFGICKRSGKMVNVLKGVLIECDPAMKQFLLYLDESNALGKKFIIQDLDETHVFVLAELVNFLQERVGELMDQNSFPITQK